MLNGILSSDKIKDLENQPCENIPNKLFHLWSIAEIMERFFAATFASVVSNLESMRCSILANLTIEQPPDYAIMNELFSIDVKRLQEINLSAVIKSQIELIERAIKEEIDGMMLAAHLHILENSIATELTSSYFLRIPEGRRFFFDQRKPLFGQEVADIFQSASYDISAAGRCFALDEWTACVFHLMRVLEIGLRDMAKNVGLDESAMELENWKVVIDQIEKKIKELESTPKSTIKSEKLRFYSEAASGFRYFKDAWRNHVSHARTHYDEREALVIYNNVLAFMQTLAKQRQSEAL